MKTWLRIAGMTAAFPMLLHGADVAGQGVRPSGPGAATSSAAPPSTEAAEAAPAASSPMRERGSSTSQAAAADAVSGADAQRGASGAANAAGAASEQAKPKAPPRPPSIAPIDVPKRYPPGTIKDPDRAEAALADITAQQEWIDIKYINDQRACYPKFFTTDCLEAARELHRSTSAALRPVEVEANAFLRRYKVQQRDLALTQRRDEDEADRARREQAQKDRESKLTSNAADKARKAGQPAAVPDDRVARHEERLRKDREVDAANAGKRAANVAAFEKKKLESEQRQREVATKKVEKDRERAQKAAAAAQSAASKPTSAAVPGAAAPAVPAAQAAPSTPTPAIVPKP